MYRSNSIFDHLEWRLNGTTLESATGDTGAITSSLFISPPELVDFGEYSCLARNTNGEVLVEAISAGFLSVYGEKSRRIHQQLK